MKYVVFLGDGMADYPIAALDGKTPLEAAKHPAMDELARRGTLGLARTIPNGMPKGSDVANLSVMGYDPKSCYSGRSPFEAVNIGVQLDATDVTYRCNLVTLSGSEHVENAVMADYSAGEISSDEAAQLIELMNERFEDAATRFYPGVSYRHCLVLKDAKDGALLTPPHDISGKPVRDYLPSGEHGSMLNGMMEYAYSVLRDSPVNKARVSQGKNPANCVWFWGEGRKPILPSFEQKYGVRGGVISAVDLLHGIGRCAGLRSIHVPNVTGNYHTDFAAKGRAAIEALSTDCDFVYIHVEAPDECGHHGELPEKVWSIEQIDSKIVVPVMQYLDNSTEDYAVLLMPDHPTPISILTHADDPVPFALYRKGDSGGCARRFTEADASATGVFKERAHELMDQLMMGR
ncbi:MAG: cofactor-independent phosphoglycerate mutase [Clostridia bacterium]